MALYIHTERDLSFFVRKLNPQSNEKPLMKDRAYDLEYYLEKK